jgi:hypothetical protein
MADLKSSYKNLLNAAIEQNKIAAEAGKLTESEEIPNQLLGMVNGHLVVGILRQEGEGTFVYHFYYSNAKPKRDAIKPVLHTTTEAAEASIVQTPSFVTETVQDYPVLSFIAIFLTLLIISKKFDLK